MAPFDPPGWLEQGPLQASRGRKGHGPVGRHGIGSDRVLQADAGAAGDREVPLPGGRPGMGIEITLGDRRQGVVAIEPVGQPGPQAGHGDGELQGIS